MFHIQFPHLPQPGNSLSAKISLRTSTPPTHGWGPLASENWSVRECFALMLKRWNWVTRNGNLKKNMLYHPKTLYFTKFVVDTFQSETWYHWKIRFNNYYLSYMFAKLKCISWLLACQLWVLEALSKIVLASGHVRRLALIKMYRTVSTCTIEEWRNLM